VVLEVGPHSPWASRLLAACGLEVVVANPRQVPLIARGGRKSDSIDSENLARLGRMDPKLLRPIRHRGAEAQKDLAMLRARNGLVAARTKLTNTVKGLDKAFGSRLTGTTPDNFHLQALQHIPEELRASLADVVATVGTLTANIRQYDRKIEHLCTERYPETQRLRQVPGVGPVTSLCYVLVLEDPRRFAKGRSVGNYLGLTPRQHDSGDSQPQLRISKAGDSLLRWLLIQCAHCIMQRGADTDLKRHGVKIAERGGKNAKKRAVVAVARKLAVLLHRMWTTGETYQALRNPTTKGQ
jgi:transposase